MTTPNSDWEEVPTPSHGDWEEVPTPSLDKHAPMIKAANEFVAHEKANPVGKAPPMDVSVDVKEPPQVRGRDREIPQLKKFVELPYEAPPPNQPEKPDALEAAGLHALDAATSGAGVPVGLPRVLGLEAGLQAMGGGAVKDVPVEDLSSLGAKLKQLYTTRQNATKALVTEPGAALSRFKEAYSPTVEQGRSGMQKAFEEHPTASTIGTIAPALLARKAPGGLIGKAAVGALGGAGINAASSDYGSSEQLKNAALGAGLGAAGAVNPLLTGVGLGAAAADMPDSPQKEATNVAALLGILGGTPGIKGAAKISKASGLLPEIAKGVEAENAPKVAANEKLAGVKAKQDVARLQLEQKAKEAILGDLADQQAQQAATQNALQKAMAEVEAAKARKISAMGTPARSALELASKYGGNINDPRIPAKTKALLIELQNEFPRLLEEGTMGMGTFEDFKNAAAGHHDTKIADAEAKLAALIKAGQTPQPAPEIRLPPEQPKVAPELIKALLARPDFQQKNAALHAKANAPLKSPVPIPKLEQYLAGEVKPQVEASALPFGIDTGLKIAGNLHPKLKLLHSIISAGRSENLADNLGKYQKLNKSGEALSKKMGAVRNVKVPKKERKNE